MISKERALESGILWSICILAVLLLYSPVFYLGTDAIPSGGADAPFFVWNFWWMKECITEGKSLYFADTLFAPKGASLVLHTLVEGLVYPLTWLFTNLSTQLLYTLACMLCFVLNAISAFYLFKKLSSSFSLALFFAGAFAFHPYFIGHLHVGHLNLLCFFPATVSLLLFLDLISEICRNNILKQLLLGASLGYLAYLSLNYLYFTTLILFCFAIVALCSKRKNLKELLRSFAIPCFVFCVIASPKVYSVVSLAESAKYTPNHDPRTHSVDLSSYFIPQQGQIIGQTSQAKELQSKIALHRGESSVYLGMSLLGICFVFATTLLKRRKFQGTGVWLLTSLFFFLLSLGPIVRFQGERLGSGYLYRILETILPLFPSVPARFAIIVVLCLMSFVCLAYQRLELVRSAKAKVFFVLALSLLVVEYFPAPIKTSHVSSSEVFTNIKEDLSIKSLHDAGDNYSAMARQMFHGKAITAGYLARRPKKAERKLKRNDFIEFLEGVSGKPALRADWNSLGVDALLVERSRRDLVGRIELLPWMIESYKDAGFIVYRESSLPAR